MAKVSKTLKIKGQSIKIFFDYDYSMWEYKTYTPEEFEAYNKGKLSRLLSAKSKLTIFINDKKYPHAFEYRQYDTKKWVIINYVCLKTGKVFPDNFKKMLEYFIESDFVKEPVY